LIQSVLPGETQDPEHVLPDAIESQKGYYSLTYDSFVGHHLFEYLAKAVHEKYGVNIQEIQEACKIKFAECFPNALERMPEHVYYYSDKCTDGFTQEIVNTKIKPLWR
jgi:hypothetical protein